MEYIKTIMIACAAFLSAFVILDTQSALRIRWELRYAREMVWQNLSISLSNNEYFMPSSPMADALVIRDRNTTALLFLRKPSVGIEQLRVVAAKDCELNGCLRVNEQQKLIGAVHAYVLSYALPKSPPILQQHILVEGSGVWLQYTGPASDFIHHQSTIERLIDELAKNAGAHDRTRTRSERL
ncbi:MAG: hypothetical protein ACLGI6_13045 [Gammaproteobacteria bacterium]